MIVYDPQERVQGTCTRMSTIFSITCDKRESRSRKGMGKRESKDKSQMDECMVASQIASNAYSARRTGLGPEHTYLAAWPSLGALGLLSHLPPRQACLRCRFLQASCPHRPQEASNLALHSLLPRHRHRCDPVQLTVLRFGSTQWLHAAHRQHERRREPFPAPVIGPRCCPAKAEMQVIHVILLAATTWCAC